MAPVAIVASHQRNHHHHHHHHHRYYDNCTPRKFGSFGSPPSRNFQAIHCRTFQSEEGLLPTPIKPYSTTPVNFSASFSPKTPSINDGKQSSKRTNPTLLNIEFEKEETLLSEFHLFERWAGPVYSNSPPPSSLPMPRSLLRPKRTTSLDLPYSPSEIDVRHMAKSAPSSPTWKQRQSVDLFGSDDSATKTLRRILNLDITD